MSEFSSAVGLPTIALGRRAFLKVGSLALGGLTLADELCRRALAGETSSEPTAVIQISMGGGPSHIDMYDLKPNAPREIRGEFQPISTSLPGFQISEHLPYQSKIMDKVAIVRSVHHGNASHLPASHWMMTGHNPTAATTRNINPSIGSVVSRLRGSNHPVMPAYVSVPRRQSLGASGFLGPAYNPFTTESDPSKSDFNVMNLKIPDGMTLARLEDRRELRKSFDRLREDIDVHQEFDGINRFTRQAMEMVTSDRALNAFDLTQEDPRVRESYGPYSVGQGCLLARRLVEAGVTFVTVLSGGDWDTHANNFSVFKQNCMQRIDHAVTALEAERECVSGGRDVEGSADALGANPARRALDGDERLVAADAVRVIGIEDIAQRIRPEEGGRIDTAAPARTADDAQVHARRAELVNERQLARRDRRVADVDVAAWRRADWADEVRGERG